MQAKGPIDNPTAISIAGVQDSTLPQKRRSGMTQHCRRCEQPTSATA